MRKASSARRKQKTSTPVLLIVLAVLLILIAVMGWMLSRMEPETAPELPQDTDHVQSDSEAEQQPDTEGENVPGEESGTSEGEAETPEETEQGPILLQDGLQIIRMGSYAGMYMEDGSNEIVSDVMMLILENAGTQDLQLARINVVYADYTAEFEVTNLPVGEKVVLLELNRKSWQEGYERVEAENVVFFQQPMDLRDGMLELNGSEGSIEVKNISGEDIDGVIYIYYKNSASDLLYGGITYRAKVEGLSAGESQRVMTGHYSPDSCRLLMAEWSE